MNVRGGLALLALLLSGLVPAAGAQTTDGYHAIQVFPVVVDSGSFAQRFHFRAAEPWEPIQILVRYYPGQGTAQGAPLDCPAVDLPVLGQRTFASLRELCPALATGSNFGTLVARSQTPETFAAYSRVSNPAGAGFSVEAFPASTFTSATTAVTGLRRLAATGSTPAYQSNCFLGNLAELTPNGAPVAAEVDLNLADGTGALIGQTTLTVQPGQLVRVLDVFAAVGAPAGNHDNAVASFVPLGFEAPGLLSFCTVQDNTSFGADFRIGKQEYAWGAFPGAQDWGATRLAFVAQEAPIDDQLEGADLAIPAGATRNVHLFYFRHPDLVTCGLQVPESAAFVTAAYGLELRLRVQDDDGTWRVVAGGNNATLFESVYLGDKARQGAGANTRYLVEVESNGQNAGSNRPYELVCISGSGSTQGELLRKGLPLTF